MQQPIKNWIRMNGALAALVAGEGQDAVRRFARLPKNGPTPPPKKSASSPASLSKQASSSPSQINRSRLRSRDLYSNENFEAFGLLCFGVHDWTIGEAANASAIFTSFLSATLPDLKAGSTNSSQWPQTMHPTAIGVAEIEKDLAAVTDAESARALAEKVRAAQDELKLGGKLATRLKAIEADLIAKGANP